MRRTHLVIAAAIAAPLFLAGCGSEGGEDAKESGAASPSESVSFQPPTDAQKKEIIAALNKIDPALGKAEDTAIYHAMNTCDDIRIVKDQATVISYTINRFRSDNIQMDENKAAAIVTAIKNIYCKV
ncbi:MAG TPA: hypothetical protein VLH10_06340 [Yinghuangia sp.]|jgi:outer membrane murein-binding lipoprotein Lpp|uniref:hypothetical protein n=1 Tax=Yinghuangia sp. YIM S10712 TaxID=3436930 RepID=UPI002C1DD22F|nr:hypothetical protein [Yinghuangia sp.]